MREQAGGGGRWVVSASRDSLGRALVLGLSLVALLAAGGWFVFERFGAAPPRPVMTVAPAPPPESRPAPVVVPDVRATVAGVKGVVERTHGEGWVELRVGDELEPDDAVRTGPGARYGPGRTPERGQERCGS